MIILGVDAHKRTHTLVAIDDAGRKLGERTVAATTDGHLQALNGSRAGRSVALLLKIAATFLDASRPICWRPANRSCAYLRN